MQDSINNQSMLKVGTILHSTYRIDAYLSSGGFGNTYVATNIEFDERVAIKEFFMKGVTQRDENQTTISVSNVENKDSFNQQLEKFKKEARRIRQLKNEHIVSVHDLFEENGTAYYVMDYVDGENLSQRLKRTGKPMSEKKVREILPQILDALKTVHDAGIWHLDLKPANIMLDKDGNVKLIDFGASKQLNSQKGGATTSTAISYTNGYAPREQMEQNYDKFGPWTDIYALGATLYNLLTNKRPPLPSDIDDDESEDKHEALPFPASVSEEMKRLVLSMMKTNRMRRPQSINDIVKSNALNHDSARIGAKKKRNDEFVSESDDEEILLASGNNEETLLADNHEAPDDSTDKNEEQTCQNDIGDGSNHTIRNVFLVLMSIGAVFCLYKFCTTPSERHEELEVVELDTLVEGVDYYESDYADTVVAVESTLLNGYHTETYSNGKYVGYFKDGNRHGTGTYYWDSGERYEGDWKDGNRTGEGTYWYANPEDEEPYKYVGSFVDNDMTGYGTEYLVGGDMYQGYFKNGLYDGKGTYYDAEAQVYETCVWENGKRIRVIEGGTWQN